jgi:hypothetical protein
MNSIIKGGLLLTVGAVIGYFVGTKVAGAKYEAIIEEEIADIKGRFEKKRKQLISDVEKDMGEEVSATRQKEERAAYKKVVGGLGYVEYGNGEIEEINDTEQEDYDKYQGLSEAPKNGRPYIISNGAYYEDMDHYDKLNLTYYEDDDVLTDDGEEVIIDPTSLVGDKALTSFGQESEDPEVVYVRNDKLGADYEIIRLSKSYAETVLGITAEEWRRNTKRGKVHEK